MSPIGYGRGSGSTTSVSPSTAATRTVSPSSPLAAGAPDLAAHPHPARADHLGPLADHPLRPGGHPVAAQEADPQEQLADLDQRRADQHHDPPWVGQHEQAGDREREDHASDDDWRRLPLGRPRPPSADAAMCVIKTVGTAGDGPGLG